MRGEVGRDAVASGGARWVFRQGMVGTGVAGDVGSGEGNETRMCGIEEKERGRSGWGASRRVRGRSGRVGMYVVVHS